MEENIDVTVRSSDIDISLGMDMEIKCTINACIEDNEINKLQCGQCKRKVHYKCSRLPAYQLQRYLVASLGQYYSKFLCANCVNVPDSILKEMTMSDNLISLENELTMQQEKIEAYEKELHELRKLAALQQETEKTSSKKRKLGERSNSNEEFVLREEGRANNNTENENQTIEDLSRMFESRFEKIEMKMIEMIEQKLPNSQEITNDIVPSFAKVVNASNPVNTNFRNIVVAAKNEELIEERDKKLRQNNIIIHGRPDNEKNEESDKQFINDMIKHISIGAVNTKSISRVGKNDSGKPRPIKVTFNNNEDKAKLMASLRHLKGKDIYNRISITDDYTLSERKMIRDYVDMAKNQNKELGEEAKTILVVRGSPKNGLYLKEVTKEKHVTVQNEITQSNSQQVKKLH